MKTKIKLMTIFMLLFALAIAACDIGGGGDESGDSGGGAVGPLAEILYRDMVSITGGTYNQHDTTYYGYNHTIFDFSIGRYEVTYELWYAVYQWAIANGYTFAHAGKEGSNYLNIAGAPPTANKYQPVTNINWRDAIIWCNAYSEMTGKTPAYYTDAGFTIYLKTSTNNATIDTTAGSEDNPYVNWTANGYRLPTEGEWQYAASGSGNYAPNYASGAADDRTDETETGKVAWWSGNSGNTTHNVGTTENPSAFNLRDVSGNVREWCWDWHGAYPETYSTPETDYKGPDSGTARSMRGGSCGNPIYELQVGYRRSANPDFLGGNNGLRVASSQ